MEPSEVQPAEQTPPRGRRFTLQWSLTTMLLLMVVVAAWVPYVRFRRQIPQIEERIEVMRDMTRELIVEDPTQITAVHLPQMWYDEHRWDVHLPEGKYRMQLATREVDKDGFPAAMEQTSLSGGEHRIELLQSQVEDCWKVTVTIDDRSVLEIVEQPGWPPSQSSSGASRIGNCRQYSPDEPLELFRRRYMYPIGDNTNSSRTPDGPTEGLMLWIEPITGKPSKPITDKPFEPLLSR